MNSTQALRELVLPWLQEHRDGVGRLARASGVQQRTVLAWLERPSGTIARELLTHACVWCEEMQLDDDASLRLILAFYAAHGGTRGYDDLLHFSCILCDYARDLRNSSASLADDFANFYSSQVDAIQRLKSKKPISKILLQ
jgi:hypothetical protein